LATRATHPLSRWPMALAGSVFLLIALALMLMLASGALQLTAGSAHGENGSTSLSLVAQLEPTRLVRLNGETLESAYSRWLLVGLCLLFPWLTVPASVFVFAVTAVACASGYLTGWISLVDARFFLCALLAIYALSLLSMFCSRLCRRRRVQHALRHHGPQHLVRYYMDNPLVLSSGGDSRTMTIMFCDIRQFTTISERLDPDHLSMWLNRYFEVVSALVVKHGGTIDKYMGDSVMAFWGAPRHSDTHVRDALIASQEILEHVEQLSATMVTQGLPALEVGIGLSAGKANVGHLGSHYHMAYTVVGDAVNTADRLQRCTGFYNVPLIVNDMVSECMPEYLFREIDTVHVKGRKRFVRIYQPIGYQSEALPNVHRQLQVHRKAMQNYRRGMLDEAQALFEKLSEETNEPDFYRMYIDRLEEMRDRGADSDHVVDFTRKMN